MRYRHFINNKKNMKMWISLEKRISFFTGEVSAIYSICPLLPLNVTTTGDDIPTIFSSRRLRRLCAVASVAKCIQQYPNLTTIKTRKAIHIFLLSRFFSFTFCVCSFRVFFSSLFARTCVWVVSVRAIVNTYGRRTHLLLIFPSMLYCVLCVDVPIENYQFHIYRECTHTGTQTQCGGSLLFLLCHFRILQFVGSFNLSITYNDLDGDDDDDAMLSV